MERQYQENGMIPLHDYDQYPNEFGLIDFLDEAVFDQFVDLIRGDGIDQSPLPVNVNFINTHQTYDCNNIVGLSNFDGGFLPPPPSNPLELFDFDVDVAAVVHGGDVSRDDGLQHKGVEDEEEEMMDDEESSGTTTTTPPPKGKGKKGDRSRTLISERRRRSRMKDKLYALRSLVPNITKMDKASIVGDAVLYVKDLQTQAKKLRADVCNLEQSLARGGGNNNNKLQGRSSTNDQNTKNIHATNYHPITKKILKMDVFQVEERGFYVRVVCNKGNGVAMLLYKALESLTSFSVQTSNLATSTAGNYVFTFTLHIMEQEMDINLSNLKLWIASIFLNKGFEFETSQSI